MAQRKIKFTLEARARVNPSEDSMKVLQAIRNLLYDSEISYRIEESMVIVKTEDMKSLEHIKDMLRDRRVRAAARKLAEDSKRDNTFLLLANKQAATVGILSLCSSNEESPLGPIELWFYSDSIDEVIDFLTAYD
jgi:predicted RNA binding protein with dsRBD fold (UPF0201 family)